MAKRKKAGRPKARTSNLPARRPAAKTPAKRRRRKGSLSSGSLSGSSFSVMGKAIAEATFGALVANVVNSAVKGQSAAVRVVANVIVPIGISKMSGKPMMAAGAAGVAGINVIKVFVPNSRFLSDFEPDSIMNDLNDNSNGSLQAHNYAQVSKINSSRWANL